jgi:GNAT superfamily N-acetyltransferase
MLHICNRPGHFHTLRRVALFLHSMSQEAIELRKAATSDLPEVVRICTEAVKLLNAEGNFQWNETYPVFADFEKDVANNELWVATVDGKVAGFAALTMDQPEEYAHVGWDISEPAIVPHRVATDPAHRGKSIAAKFMHKAEDLAREAGYKSVRVDTNKINMPMQKMFNKLEYKYAGDIKLKGKPSHMDFVCYHKLM